MRSPDRNNIRRAAWPETHHLQDQMMRHVRADIEALDHELALYETSYGMSTQDFYASYAQGTDGRLWSPDFVAWGNLYVARLEREALYRRMLDQYSA